MLQKLHKKTTNKQNTRVIVGMSGGVDSSVAALLLKQQGYQVEGLFMKNWEEDDGEDFCQASRDLADTKQVCNKIGIPLHTANFSHEYWENVFTHFLSEYKLGRTPNPDVLCNKEIKFKLFLDYAQNLQADYIATGHYATNELSKNYFLKKSKDLNKDQTYFLYTLGQTQLEKTIFPLATLEKHQIREIAQQAGFDNHNKKDSTGICFIGERKFKSFLQKYLPAQPGTIVTELGKTIGQHDGLMYYTIGQRQGLGIGGTANTDNTPWYVIEKNLTTNKLIVGQGNSHPRLFKSNLKAEQLSWVSGCSPKTNFFCKAKIRYRQQEQACNVIFNPKSEPESVSVKFNTPQRSIAAGQSIVFYNKDICLGGGIIVDSY